MIYSSTRLEQFEIEKNEIIRFPEGLYAFENEKEFALLPFNEQIDCPLQWLHSLKTPDLAFVVTDPYIYMPDYKFSLSQEDKRHIRLRPEDRTLIRVIVKIPKNFLEMTANFLAPIVINLEQKIARQFVLTSIEYDTSQYLLPEEIRESKAIV